MTQRLFKRRRRELREYIKAAKSAEEREALQDQLARLRAEYAGKLPNTAPAPSTVPASYLEDPELNALLEKARQSSSSL